MYLYDPNAKLSEHYTLSSLTLTNQPLSYPNFPESADHFSNLAITADVLEQLAYYVGPFTLLSAYRTKELQSILASQGEPTSAGLSNHEIGLGVDITPTSMTLADYFAYILASDNIKNLFTEIAIKPSQNAIHLGIRGHNDSRTTKITGLNSQGVYAKLSLDEIAAYISPVVESVDAAYYAAAKLVTTSRIPLILALVAAAGGVIYFVLAKPARAARNPRGLLR